MTASIQTSAPATCAMALTGILQHAEVAMKPTGDGHFVPAIVVQLDDVGAGHHHVVAHITYPPSDRAQAEADAKRLEVGKPLTVTTQLVDVRLLLPAASLSHDNP